MTPPAEAPRTPILFNSQGLRAGWCLLLYLLLVVLLYIALASLLAPTHRVFTAGYVAWSEAMGCLAFLTAALIMSRVERRPFTSYGLSPTRLLPNLLSGLLAGFAFLSALVAVLYLTHHLAFEPPILHGPAAILRGLAWLIAFALVGLQEEFSTRGYLQYTLTRAIAGLTRILAPGCRYADSLAFWLAAAILSIGLFTALHAHNSGETRTGLLAVALAGLTFVFSLWRTGTLWWAIGFHTTWDWAQSFLFGVPDSGTVVANHLFAAHPQGSPLLSGGTTGPEGSLLALPTLLLVCITVHLTYPPRPRQRIARQKFGVISTSAAQIKLRSSRPK